MRRQQSVDSPPACVCAMGLLSQGSPLNWEETKKYADHIRKHGIIQFLNIYNKVKDRQKDVLKWGDEVRKFRDVADVVETWPIIAAVTTCVYLFSFPSSGFLHRVTNIYSIFTPDLVQTFIPEWPNTIFSKYNPVAYESVNIIVNIF